MIPLAFLLHEWQIQSDPSLAEAIPDVLYLFGTDTRFPSPSLFSLPLYIRQKREAAQLSVSEQQPQTHEAIVGYQQNDSCSPRPAREEPWPRDVITIRDPSALSTASAASSPPHSSPSKVHHSNQRAEVAFHRLSFCLSLTPSTCLSFPLSICISLHLSSPNWFRENAHDDVMHRMHLTYCCHGNQPG